MKKTRNRHAKISLRAREIIKLRDVQHQSWKDIAAHFGTTIAKVNGLYRRATAELKKRADLHARNAKWLEDTCSIYRPKALKSERRLAIVESRDEGSMPLPVRVPRPGDFGSPEREERIKAAQAHKAQELAEKFEDPADQEEREAQETAAEQARQMEAAQFAALPVVYLDGSGTHWDSRSIAIKAGEVVEREGKFYHGNDEVRVVNGPPPALPWQQKPVQPVVEHPDPVAESLGSHIWTTPQADATTSPMAHPGLGDKHESAEVQKWQQPVQPFPDPTRKPVMVEPSMEKPAEPTLLEPIDLTPKTTGTQVAFDDDGWLLNFAGQPIPWKWRDGQRVNEITGDALDVRPMPKFKKPEPVARIR